MIVGVKTAALGSSLFSGRLSPLTELVGVFFPLDDVPAGSPSFGLVARLTPATLATASFSLTGSSEMERSGSTRGCRMTD